MVCLPRLGRTWLRILFVHWSVCQCGGALGTGGVGDMNKVRSTNQVRVWYEEICRGYFSTLVSLVEISGPKIESREKRRRPRATEDAPLILTRFG